MNRPGFGESNFGPDDRDMEVAKATCFHFTEFDRDVFFILESEREAYDAAVARFDEDRGFTCADSVKRHVESVLYLENVEVNENLRRLGFGTAMAANLLRRLSLATHGRLVIADPRLGTVIPDGVRGTVSHRIANRISLAASGQPDDSYWYAHIADPAFAANLESLSVYPESAIIAARTLYLDSVSG